MSEEVIQKLKSVLKEKIPGLNPDSINLQDNIRLLGIDSLDFVELIYEMETTFQIEIPTDQLTKIDTVQSLLDVITNQSKVLA